MSDQNQTTARPKSRGVSSRLMHLFTQGHVEMYRRTSGKLGGGEHLLILTTHGRKTGKKRSTPVFYFRDGEHYVIIASAGGAKNDPLWWLNLKQTPEANIQIADKFLLVTARQAQGEERDRLWSIIAANYKNFIAYQKRTTRVLPIVILTTNTPT
jgi:deazaflavin-dependent oxidoreductase (nitroreductase family)